MLQQSSRILSLLITLGLVSLLFKGAVVQATVPTQPEETVTAFYKWYLHALNMKVDPFKAGKSTLMKYVTASRISTIEKQMASPDGLDADYFLQAQDWLDEWEKEIFTQKAITAGDSATVVVTLGQKKENQQRLTVRLRHEATGWKIDKAQ